MNGFQQIPSTISIESGPSSVIDASIKSIQNNDTAIFHSFIKQNQMNLLQNQSIKQKANILLNTNNDNQFRNKCLKTELNYPRKFNQLKILTKYSAVVQTDSQKQFSSDPEDLGFMEQKSHVGECCNRDKINKRQIMRPLIEKQMIKKNQKDNSLSIKQDSKHLCQTAASQSTNLLKIVSKQNMKNILFRQISKNKALQDQLTRVKQENSQLRSIISEFNNKKLTHQQINQDFISKCKMKQAGSKANLEIRCSNKKQKNKKNDQCRRINTEGNLLMKSQSKRILKIQKKIDKFQQVLNSLKTKIKRNTKETKQSRLIKRTRLKGQRKYEKENNSKFQ